jgi:hypothetical protein
MITRVEFHPRLVEEAVWAAVARIPGAGAFHRARESAYTMPDPEERERAFTRLHFEWFERLDVGRPVATALGEREAGLRAAERFLVGSAANGRSEGVELFVAPRGERSIVANLRAQTLVDGPACLTLLRRELLHIEDMLDPSFAYEPRLPSGHVGPAQERRLQDRYRILWRCSVDGRLLRWGLLGAAARDERRVEFERAFAFLADQAGRCFDRLFLGTRPTHPELVRMAGDPEAGFGLESRHPASAGRCPLCGFPTFELERSPAGLPPEVRRVIASEFADWRPEQGICPQCADLYRLRPSAVPLGR